MIQNMMLKTSSGDKMLVAANNSSAFTKWLSDRFETPTRLSASVIVGVGNKFDQLGHEGVAYRGDIIDFLWNRQGQTVKFEVK